MDFYTEIRNLTHSSFDINDCNDEQKQLYDAATAFIAADEAKAEHILRNLFDCAQDSEIKNMAANLLFSLLLWQDRFDDLAQFGIPKDGDDEETIMAYDTRNMTITLSPTPKELDMSPAISNLPSVCVQINGVDVELLIDTGAMITTVSESVAKKCGIVGSNTLVDVKNPYETSVATQFSFIESLMVGNSEFKHKSCVIIPDSMLDMGEKDAPPINGTIGWEIIKRLLWTIDYKNRSVRIEAPTTKSADTVMCCDFFPMVNIKINDKNLTVGLDTGSKYTHFGKCLNNLFGELEQSNKTSSGVGHKQEEFGANIPHIDVSMGNSRFELESAWLYSDREYSFSKTFMLPGVLGSDIAQNKTLIIDYPNRNLTITD